MKVYRHRYQSQTGPPLTILHPTGESTKAKHGLGATISHVQKLAETGETGQVWTIMEYDATVATVTRTVAGVHTREAA